MFWGGGAQCFIVLCLRLWPLPGSPLMQLADQLTEGTRTDFPSAREIYISPPFSLNLLLSNSPAGGEMHPHTRGFITPLAGRRGGRFFPPVSCVTRRQGKSRGQYSTEGGDQLHIEREEESFSSTPPCLHGRDTRLLLLLLWPLKPLCLFLPLSLSLFLSLSLSLSFPQSGLSHFSGGFTVFPQGGNSVCSYSK